MNFLKVSEERFELSRVSPLGPKPSASASSATPTQQQENQLFFLYSSSISKIFFFVFSNFGRIIVSKPFLMVALALSALIS